MPSPQNSVNHSREQPAQVGKTSNELNVNLRQGGYDVISIYEQLVGFGIARNSRNRVRGTGISLAADHTDRPGSFGVLIVR